MQLSLARSGARRSKVNPWPVGPARARSRRWAGFIWADVRAIGHRAVAVFVDEFDAQPQRRTPVGFLALFLRAFAKADAGAAAVLVDEVAN